MNIFLSVTILSARNYCILEEWSYSHVRILLLCYVHLSHKISCLIQATVNLVLLRTADWSRNQRKENSRKYTHSDTHTHTHVRNHPYSRPGYLAGHYKGSSETEAAEADGAWQLWLSTCSETNPLVASGLCPSVAPAVLALCWQFRDGQAMGVLKGRCIHSPVRLTHTFLSWETHLFKPLSLCSLVTQPILGRVSLTLPQ